MCKPEEHAPVVKTEMRRGRVKWFNQEKGYGFIETENRRDVFVHFSTLSPERRENIQIGVEIDLSDGSQQNS